MSDARRRHRARRGAFESRCSGRHRSRRTSPTSRVPAEARLGSPRPRAATAVTAGSETTRSEEHTSELQSQSNLVCRLLLEKKKKKKNNRKKKKKKITTVKNIKQLIYI